MKTYYLSHPLEPQPLGDWEFVAPVAVTSGSVSTTRGDSYRGISDNVSGYTNTEVLGVWRAPRSEVFVCCQRCDLSYNVDDAPPAGVTAESWDNWTRHGDCGYMRLERRRR
jgi:hypothetical protein